MPDPFIGRKIGDYEIRSLLGQGGMAIVYLAHQEKFKRDVAVKVVSKLIAQDPTFLDRFNREVSLAARLQHAHIVPVFDYGTTEDGLTYLAMRHIQGGSLADRIRQGPIAIAQVKKWFNQIAEALEYAHQQGIIHRDIKPSNILIDASGDAYLVDFGLARVVDVDGGESALTKSSTFMGTPLYMSPEQIEQRPLDRRSDLYSLGIVLWEMIVGSAPFSHESTFRVMQMHLTDTPPALRRLRPDLPPDLEAVLMKSLEKKLERRYQTTREMIDAFNNSTMGYFTSGTSQVVNRPTNATEAITDTLTGVITGRYPKARRNMVRIGGIVGIIVAILAVGLLTRGTAPAPTALRITDRPKLGKLDDLRLSEAEITRAKEHFKGSFIGIIACSLSAEYPTSLAAASCTRAQELGFTVKLEDADNKPERQPTLINKLIAEGTKGIALCPLNVDSSKVARETAAQAGVVIAMSDQSITPGGVSFSITNEVMGRTAGEYAAKYVNEKMGGKAKVIVLGYRELPQLITREDEMVNAFKAGAPNVTVLASYTGGTEDLGQLSIEKALVEHPGFDLIISINDAGALGGVRALRSANIKPSAVKIVSIDAVQEVRRLMLEDEFFIGSVNTSPVVVGRYSIDAILKVSAGGVVPEVIELPLVIITKENAQESP
jgi:ABC-type sugar transport system substrate-binding protein